MESGQGENQDENDGLSLEVRPSLIGPTAGNGLFVKPGAVFKAGDTICRMPSQKWRLSTSQDCGQSPLAHLEVGKDLPAGYLNYKCNNLISHPYLTRLPEDAIVTVQTRWPRTGTHTKTGVFFVWPEIFSVELPNRPLYYSMNHSNNPNAKMAVDDKGLKWVRVIVLGNVVTNFALLGSFT